MKKAIAKIFLAGFLLLSANNVFSATAAFDGLPMPGCDNCSPIPK